MASSKFAAHQSYTKYALNKQNCRGGGAKQGKGRVGQGLSCRFCVVVLLLAVVVCCISLAACTCLYVCVCVCIFEFLIRSDTHTLAHTHTHAHLRTNWLFCRNLQGACKYATFNAAAINSLQPPCFCIPKQWPPNTHSITYTHTHTLACMFACLHIIYTLTHTHTGKRVHGKATTSLYTRT